MRTLPPTNSVDGLLEVHGHNGNANTTARHNDHFDELPFLLKILRHHNGGAISGKAHTQSNYYSYKIEREEQ